MLIGSNIVAGAGVGVENKAAGLGVGRCGANGKRARTVKVHRDRVAISEELNADMREEAVRSAERPVARHCIVVLAVNLAKAESQMGAEGQLAVFSHANLRQNVLKV